jgi:hypothetical protein
MLMINPVSLYSNIKTPNYEKYLFKRSREQEHQWKDKTIYHPKHDRPFQSDSFIYFIEFKLRPTPLGFTSLKTIF